jgi:hypothetical protein
MQHLRNKLIETILEFSKDEFRNYNDLVNLAKMTDEKLVLEIINILEYYASGYKK